MSGVFTVFWVSKEKQEKYDLRQLYRELKILLDARCTGIAPSPWSHRPGVMCFFRDEKSAIRFVVELRESNNETTDDIEQRGEHVAYLVPRRLNAITISALRNRSLAEDWSTLTDPGVKPIKKLEVANAF